MFSIGRNSDVLTRNITATKPPLAKKASLSSMKNLSQAATQHYIKVIPRRGSLSKKLVLKVLRNGHTRSNSGGSKISNKINPMEEEIQ
jgi:hypothetical protein